VIAGKPLAADLRLSELTRALNQTSAQLDLTGLPAEEPVGNVVGTGQRCGEGPAVHGCLGGSRSRVGPGHERGVAHQAHPAEGHLGNLHVDHALDEGLTGGPNKGGKVF